MTAPTRSLAEALRDLPVPDPPPDGWQRLRRSLAEPPARRWPALAAAAVLLVGLALGLRLWPGVGPSLDQAAGGDGPAAPGLAALREESMQWELLLGAQSGGVTSASSAYAELALAERIALVDLLLPAASSDAERRALWGERVLLLRDLYRVRGDPAAVLAEAGGAPSLLTVAL